LDRSWEWPGPGAVGEVGLRVLEERECPRDEPGRDSLDELFPIMVQLAEDHRYGTGSERSQR